MAEYFSKIKLPVNATILENEHKMHRRLTYITGDKLIISLQTQEQKEI